MQQRMVVGIGCSDAHAIKINLGPWKPVISDYYTCFRCINTHLLLKEPLSGEFKKDKEAVIQALRAGRFLWGTISSRTPKDFVLKPITMGR